MRTRPESRSYILQDLLFDGAKRPSPIRVLHAGGGSGIADSEWWTHFRRDALTVDAFEPSREEVVKLERSAHEHGYRVVCHPVALSGSSGERTLYVAAHAGASSLFPPLQRVNSRLAYAPGRRLSDLHEVVEERSVATMSLDDLRKSGAISDCDFMKLNVQGAELEILRGGFSLLQEAIGLQTEASFYQVYDRAPYFADVDQLLRQQGFHFFDMLAPNTIGRHSMPFEPRSDEASRFWRWPSRQLFEAHFLYLRDPIRDQEKDMPDEKLAKLVCIAEIWGQLEYAFDLLNWASSSRSHLLGQELETLRLRATERYQRPL